MKLDRKYNSIEVCCIDLLVPTKHRILCVYRPPNSGADYAALLSELIAEVCYVPHHVTIGGDFNLPDIVWPTLLYPNTPGYCALVNGVLESGVSQLVLEPTRGQSIRDVVLTTCPINVSNVKVRDSSGLSDHCVVDFSISGEQERPGFIMSRDYKKADIAGICAILANYDWDSFFDRTVA